VLGRQENSSSNRRTMGRCFRSPAAKEAAGRTRKGVCLATGFLTSTIWFPDYAQDDKQRRRAGVFRQPKTAVPEHFLELANDVPIGRHAALLVSISVDLISLAEGKPTLAGEMAEFEEANRRDSHKPCAGRVSRVRAPLSQPPLSKELYYGWP